MWKSENTNTNQRHQGKLALALVAGGLVAGCGSNDPWSIDTDGYDGLGQQTFEVLTQPCTIDATGGTMALQVGLGETLYLTMRATDSKVIADATHGGVECAVPSTYKIAVTQDGAHPGAGKVFLDYINGSFALGSTSGAVVTPGITMALGAASSVVVRGSSGIDKIYLGSTYSGASLQYNWMNVNGDTTPDVRVANVTDIKISTGPGADIISADGGNGTTGSPLDVTVTFSAFAGADADTLTGGLGTNTALWGGTGDDKFIQTATLGPDDMHGEEGFDTVDYSVRTLAVNVTVCTVCGASPLPACNVCTGDDGTGAEADTVNDDIEIVLGGKGSDTLSAKFAVCSDGAATPTVKCTVKGNDGDDTLIGSTHSDLLDGGNGDDVLQGGLGDDTFVGGAGVDTVSYADRTAAIVSASLDPAKLWVPFQNGQAGELDLIGSDVENLTGGDLADNLRGNANANIIHGGLAGDTIEGGAGNDALYGDGGADFLYGGTGNDMLIGGGGLDTLIGGDGEDFIDATEAGAVVDTLIDCDGDNDSLGLPASAGTAAGKIDALVKDGLDLDANGTCEL